ncbi:MAG: AraC family transcriptional regulator [Cyclobacteriaceae bacterium]
MNWSLNLISIGVFNGLMLSILFLRKKDHNFYFGFFLLAHTIILVKYVGNMVALYQSFHFLIAFAEILEWTVGPFLYFYVLKFNGETIKRKWIHFIPIMVYVFILIPIHIYEIRNPDSQLFNLEIQRSDVNLLVLPKILLGLMYVGLSFKRTRDKPWLGLILSVYLAEILSLALYYYQFLIFESDVISDLLVSSVMTISVNVIAISGMMKSSIFVQEPVPPIQEKPPQHSIDLKLLLPIFNQIKHHIEEHETFKNPHLRLSELSEELSIPEKQISQAVNECANENISSFINSYRIKLAEQLLVDGRFSHYTIDAIAEECGFSNKVSFYKAFKKIHNLSPKEYKTLITAETS